MPTKDALELHERVARLEAKLETFPESMVTWKQLFISVFASTITILGLIATLSFSSWSYINKKFEGYDSGMSAIETEVKAMKSSLDKLTASNNNSNNEQIVTAGMVITVLKGIAVASDPSYLMGELPAVRSLLVKAKEKKVAIPDKEYKNVATQLSDRLPKASQELKQEITATFASLSSAKSSTYLFFHQLSEAEIQKAKSEESFWENTTVDLTQKSEWRNTIFKNCKITMGDATKTVTLTRVKFVEVDFESVPLNPAGLNLLTAVLKTTGPSMTEVVEPYYVTVDPPGKLKRAGTSLKPAPDQHELATSKARSRVATRP